MKTFDKAAALRSVKVVEWVVRAAATGALLLTRFGTHLNFSPEGRPVLLLFLLASEAAVIVSVAELLNPDRSCAAQVPFIIMLVISLCWLAYAVLQWGWAGAPKFWGVLLVGVAGAVWVLYLAFKYNKVAE